MSSLTEHFLINPLTNRKIQRGGPAHRRLISKGVLPSQIKTERLNREEKKAVEQKDASHPITAPLPDAQKKPIPLQKMAESAKTPILEESPQPLTDEDDEDFFYDQAYQQFKETTDQGKYDEIIQKYEHLSVEELKLLMEMMSDQIVSKNRVN